MQATFRRQFAWGSEVVANGGRCPCVWPHSSRFQSPHAAVYGCTAAVYSCIAADYGRTASVYGSTRQLTCAGGADGDENGLGDLANRCVCVCVCVCV
eukprot:1805446-Rhodomonas_salina.8